MAREAADVERSEKGRRWAELKNFFNGVYFCIISFPMNENNEEITFEEGDEEAPGGEVKKLRERLKKCLAEKQEYLDGWQRSKADFVNARREEESRREELVVFATERVLADIVPVLDSFDAAMGNRPLWESVTKEWRIGMESIYLKLQSILKEQGTESFDPTGEPFTPSEHIAIGTITTDDLEKDDTVAEVLQRGYRLKGKILRPAKVKIFQKSN